jgi:hypothetical protein
MHFAAATAGPGGEIVARRCAGVSTGREDDGSVRAGARFVNLRLKGVEGGARGGVRAGDRAGSGGDVGGRRLVFWPRERGLSDPPRSSVCAQVALAAEMLPTADDVDPPCDVLRMRNGAAEPHPSARRAKQAELRPLRSLAMARYKAASGSSSCGIEVRSRVDRSERSSVDEQDRGADEASYPRCFPPPVQGQSDQAPSPGRRLATRASTPVASCSRWCLAAEALPGA